MRPRFERWPSKRFRAICPSVNFYTKIPSVTYMALANINGLLYPYQVFIEKTMDIKNETII